MSNIIYKPRINVYSKNKNALSTKSSERFSSTVHKEKYYKKHFDDLSEFEQKKVIKNFKIEYSLILYDYFADEDSINNKIENFTREAFNIYLPMSKVVEIHLDLIDNLEKQLIIEGLNSEYLSDFRLTLIDIIAHLGEMYRNKKCVKISS